MLWPPKFKTKKHCCCYGWGLSMDRLEAEMVDVFFCRSFLSWRMGSQDGRKWWSDHPPFISHETAGRGPTTRSLGDLWSPLVISHDWDDPPSMSSFRGLERCGMPCFLRTWGSRIGISQRWGTLLCGAMSLNDPRFFNGSLVVEILPNLTVHGTGMSKGVSLLALLCDYQTSFCAVQAM